MPSKRRPRKKVIIREPTPTPEPEEREDTDEDEEESEEEEEESDHDEVDTQQNQSHSFDPYSLEDADILRVLEYVWRMASQAPASLRESTRRQEAMNLPSQIPTTHGTPSRDEPNNQRLVEPYQTQLASDPPCSVTIVQPRTTLGTVQALCHPNPIPASVEAQDTLHLTPPIPSQPSEGVSPQETRQGLRPRDKLKLTERGQKIYRR